MVHNKDEISKGIAHKFYREIFALCRPGAHIAPIVPSSWLTTRLPNWEKLPSKVS
jgi:hypothetical protein